ncbi:hypothetical protein [Candidatus Mycobacterium methanotrophicum]|uniref:Transposase n=1 Tax=Candidatus Mycobacterium methanotrophicum TaxID=2943498 RepID=A0ABY4QHF1_9MYCO|nr:hypothetical protein [Candidatus Mycobacterium methanotrophicum]UQX09964.1 hypothetical protein M5I08_17255 [Candidatus Mycobacterium methanotrophicum]
MRASPLLDAFFELPGARVGKAAVEDGELRVTASLCRRRLECPQCRFSARHRYDTREADSSWRHLDTARRICRILSGTQAHTLREMKRSGGILWRADQTQGSAS